MDEALELCRRVLGPGEAAEAAAAAARADVAGEDRIALLAAAARACRERGEAQEPASGSVTTAASRRAADAASAAPDAPADESIPARLRTAVAQELAAASASLPERQREALALRELLRLSYDQIGNVMGMEPSAVGPLLARARLRLRAARRGGELDAGAPCQERDRALRLLAARQDSEPLSAEDDEWLLAHLGACPSCDMAHSAMLEASVCYRAWPRETPAASA